MNCNYYYYFNNLAIAIFPLVFFPLLLFDQCHPHPQVYKSLSCKLHLSNRLTPFPFYPLLLMSSTQFRTPTPEEQPEMGLTSEEEAAMKLEHPILCLYTNFPSDGYLTSFPLFPDTLVDIEGGHAWAWSDGDDVRSTPDLPFLKSDIVYSDISICILVTLGFYYGQEITTWDPY